MGGGDLNLKKSWHPSTMRNMEKVWKAEQRNDQEKKKIAELQREIMEERAREDMQKYAEDKGVVDKKDNTKLDWMYKGPGGMVNREEYLLGRSVDKTFEQQQQAEKNPSSVTTRNQVDYECLPPSIFSGGSEQVDMARKLQEDPLYAIKKKEMETRSQLLSNPVKLKQLRELIKVHKPQKVKKHKKEKKSKKNKKKRKHSSSSDSDSTDLDALLLAKYSKLKDKLRKEDITKFDGDIPDTSNSDSEVERSYKGKEPGHHKRKHHSSVSSDEGDSQMIKKPYGLQMMSSSSNARSTKLSSRSSTSNKREQDSHESNSGRHKSGQSAQWKRPEKKKLTEEEKEQRRREMMDNVQWRNQEREKNVSRYKKEEKEEKKHSKTYSTEFLTKQLAYAASHGTVESRIKANINNIQRSGMAMDKNFARR